MSMLEGTPTSDDAGAGIVGEFPCTQTQLRCWILDQLNPGNPALNVAVRWEIRGAFKAPAIEAAFRKVVQRHEILRTRFIEKAGRPYQQVVEAVDFKMPVIDLRNVAPGQRHERILAIGEETARAPFNLGEAGLLRVSLLMVENDSGFLLITAHQSCFDGWSIRVLGREVGEIAAAIDAGRPPTVPDLPLQYGDYALWQQEYLDSYGFEAEKTFWRAQLTGAPYFEVLPDRPRGPVKTNHGNILSVAQPPEFSERIDAAARAHRVSLYSYGAAIVSAMLHRLTGAGTVLFGSQVAGRDHTDLEDLIGVFINNLVLRFDFSADISFTDHIHAASETVAAVLNHQRMPFNKLVEVVNPVRDPARNPLISVNFNLQKAFLEDHRYGGFELISAPSQSPGVVYDLSFIMIGRPSGWRMSIEYNADLFDKITIEALLTLWQDTYAIALDDPAALLSSLTVAQRDVVVPDSETGPAAATEQALCGHPSVDAAVVVIEKTGSRRVHAFVTPSPASSEPLDRLPGILTDYLAASFPHGVLPDGISVLLNFPKTKTGAIDRAALRIPGPLPATMAATPVPTPPAPVTVAKSRETGAGAEKTAALSAIWSDLLGGGPVQAADNFFSLGGHSLLALRMLSAVRERFGVKPDLELLFNRPTLGGFADAIFGATPAGEVSAPSNPWELIACKRGSGPYAVYTLNHPFLYYRLANELADTVSVYNVNMFHADLDGGLTRLSLEEIAAQAIDAMRIETPAGPVAVVGLCVNGILAIEVSRQLRERGVDVCFTAMIDAWAPGFVRSLPKIVQRRWNAERRIKRVAYFTRKLLSGRMRLSDYLREFKATLGLLRILGFRAARRSPEEVANGTVTALLVDAARNYAPRKTRDASVLLFRSQANHPRACQLLFGWGDTIARNTRVIDLDGWHEDSLTLSGISTLASTMSEKFYCIIP